MSAEPEIAAALPDHDHAITADREEKKYLLPHVALGQLRTQLDRHLSQHRYTGKDANRLPEAQHFVTTIYFDTASHTQYQRAERDPHNNVKVRAKEYYDMHPTLAEVATSPDEIVHSRPWLWLELKQRSGDRSEKLRCRLAKREVQSFFDSAIARAVTDETHAVPEGNHTLDDRERIATHCQRLGDRLIPSCLVNYQRVAWQNPSAVLRVTLDFDVAFYRPPADLWTRRSALLRSTLGRPQAIEPWLIVEVKSRGEVPAWLADTLSACKAHESSFSKFVRAGRAVHR
jgi:hypothetical protein